MTEPDTRPKRVLVVDDDQAVGAFVGRTLADGGCDVTLASGGREALALVEDDSERFDLFLIDLAMPQMRGDVLARRLRGLRPEVRIIYLTAYPHMLLDGPNVLSTEDVFLEKPIAIKALLEAVSQVLFGHPRGFERRSTREWDDDAAV